jgi:uncharacterized protein (TIGR02145 family)
MAEGTLEITISNQIVAPVVLPGIFIAGWHVPTESEWDALRIYLDPLGDSLVNVAGAAMKLSGVVFWQDNLGTNISGFSAKGAGQRNEATGAFSSLRITTEYWSSDALPANCYNLATNDDSFSYTYTNTPKMGRSIRLIKDDSVNPQTVTDYDGYTYDTIKIGTQVWMASNLRTTHFADGTPIPIVTDNAAWAALTTAAMCYYNNTP